MTTRTGSTGNAIRLFVMAATFALLAISSIQGAAAQQHNDSVTNSSLNIWAKCEDAGGSPEMETTISADGHFQTIVICIGGDLDGLVCGFTSTDSFCKFMWFVPEMDDDVVAPIDDVGDVAPEPTVTPIIIDQPVDLDPVVDPGTDGSDSTDKSDEPAPEPTAEPIIDENVIVEEIAPPKEDEDAGGRELPEFQDGVVIDEVFDSGEGDDSGKGELPAMIDTGGVSGFGDAPAAGS